MIGKRFSSGSNLIVKTVYVVLALGIITAIGTGVYALTTGNIPAANPGHNSTQVYISIGSGKYVAFQDALNGGYFVGGSVSNIPQTSSPPAPYELASKILITIGGYNVTLQSAIDNGLFATPSNAKNYEQLSIPAGGEYASKVNVNTIEGVKDLQYTIANSLLSPCQPGHPWVQNQCSDNLIGGSCYPSGVDAACTNPGTWASDGVTCLGYSFLSFGAQSSCSVDKACDGSGHCWGRSGDGTSATCSQCPFGTANSGKNGGITACVHTSGGHIYQSRVYLSGTWLNWFSNNNVLCANSYNCNCDWAGGNCDTCTDYNVWQMKPYA